MLSSLWAVVRDGKIEPTESVELADGMRVLVTILPVDTDDDEQFWTAASAKSLAAVWDNTDDDVYAELLAE